MHDNSFAGKNYQQFPHFFARLKQARPDLVTASVVTWIPIALHIVSAADIRASFTPQGNDYVPADASAAKAAVKILSTETPDVLFYYIGQVDEAGHAHGFHPSVPEYTAAIHQADQHVGQVLAALEARPTRDQEDWLIAVSSDHGGKGTGHSQGHDVPEIRNSFLILNGPAAASGRLEADTFLVDVPVTVMSHLGVPAREEWQLDGRPVGLR